MRIIFQEGTGICMRSVAHNNFFSSTCATLMHPWSPRWLALFKEIIIFAPQSPPIFIPTRYLSPFWHVCTHRSYFPFDSIALLFYVFFPLVSLRKLRFPPWCPADWHFQWVRHTALHTSGLARAVCHFLPSCFCFDFLFLFVFFISSVFSCKYFFWDGGWQQTWCSQKKRLLIFPVLFIF